MRSPAGESSCSRSPARHAESNTSAEEVAQVSQVQTLRAVWEVHKRPEPRRRALDPEAERIARIMASQRAEPWQHPYSS
jgi:hypothetical protein